MESDKGSEKNNGTGSFHTIIARNVPQDVYEALWNLRRKKKAGSWAKFFKILVDEFQEEIEETQWL